MNAKLALLAAVVLSVGLITNAYAHKGQVVGDYKMEVGWKNEPPIVGKKNAIEIVVTKATSTDKKESTKNHDSDKHKSEKATIKKTSYENPPSTNKTPTSSAKSSEHDPDKKTTHSHSSAKKTGISGLGKTLEVDVTLNGKKTFLKLIESKTKKGTYYGSFTPDSEGFPTVHVVGKIKNTPVEITFHPEKVVAKK